MAVDGVLAERRGGPRSARCRAPRRRDAGPRAGAAVSGPLACARPRCGADGRAARAPARSGRRRRARRSARSAAAASRAASSSRPVAARTSASSSRACAVSNGAPPSREELDRVLEMPAGRLAARRPPPATTPAARLALARSGRRSAPRRRSPRAPRRRLAAASGSPSAASARGQQLERRRAGWSRSSAGSWRSSALEVLACAARHRPPRGAGRRRPRSASAWPSASANRSRASRGAALAAAQHGEAHDGLRAPERRASRCRSSSASHELALGVGPVAVPHEHRRVVRAAGAVDEADAHPPAERLDLAAPLRGAVVVADALARVDQVAAGPAGGRELLELAAEGGGGRLVEAAHALDHVTLVDEREPLGRQAEHLEVDVAERRRPSSRARAPSASASAGSSSSTRCARKASQPAVLGARLEALEDPLGALEPAVGDRRGAAELEVVVADPQRHPRRARAGRRRRGTAGRPARARRGRARRRRATTPPTSGPPRPRPTCPAPGQRRTRRAPAPRRRGRAPRSRGGVDAGPKFAWPQLTVAAQPGQEIWVISARAGSTASGAGAAASGTQVLSSDSSLPHRCGVDDPAMTRPALRPLTAATAAMVAGAVGVVPATAAGAPAAPPVAAHWHAPPPKAAVIPPKARPTAVNAATAREPGAPQTGLAGQGAVVAGNGIEATPLGAHGSVGRGAGAPARARAPPR